MKLYEINNEITRILDSIDDETGEITDSQFEQLSTLSIQREDKIENTALYIKTLKAEAEMIATERKRLQDKEQAANNRVKSLSNYLEAMLNGEKYKSPLNTIYYGTSSAVRVIDERQIPREYIIEQEPRIDRRGIQQAIKNGEQIAGVELEEKKYMVVR